MCCLLTVLPPEDVSSLKEAAAVTDAAGLAFSAFELKRFMIAASTRVSVVSKQVLVVVLVVLKVTRDYRRR